MIPLATPNLTGKEAEYTAEAISSGWVGPDGPFVRRFEEMVAKAAGRKWAVATITGTAALHAAARAFEFTDSVDVPKLAFPAMRNVLTALRVTVRPYIGGEEHDDALYAANGMTLNDRAPALGAPPAYLQTDVECYSFAANKTVTCGHGGAVCGDDANTEGVIRETIRQGHGRAGHA
jgi:dTDP-4-amino-4,6-dideoxygalactose transaminase